jgi:hypothetical protein
LNDAVMQDFSDYLALLDGDKAGAASLTLSAALRDYRPAAPAETIPPVGTLTMVEAASRLRVSPWTIYRLALPSYRVGIALRFIVDEIEQCEKESEATPAQKTAAPSPNIFRHHD